MYKWLTALIGFFALTSYASISVTPFTGEDDYYYYDVDVVLEGDKYVEGFGGPPTQRTYYEWIYITPHSAGEDFRFINTASFLQGSEGSTTDTQVLLYDTDNFDLNNVITMMPDIFNSGPNYGWGGGQTTETGGNGTGLDQGAFNGSFELAETEYLAVFTSFSADALGSIDIEIHGPAEITFAPIPEPTIFPIVLSCFAFLCVAIRRRYV